VGGGNGGLFRLSELGQPPLALEHQGMTDGTLPTSLFVDDVNVQARCTP
jgi:hypothetical protein